MAMRVRGASKGLRSAGAMAASAWRCKLAGGPMALAAGYTAPEAAGYAAQAGVAHGRAEALRDLKGIERFRMRATADA